MDKKFTLKNSPAIIAAEKAIADSEKQEALAIIDWRKRLHLKPWQTFADVSLPEEYFESQLAKIDNLQSFLKSYYQTLCDLLAMSSDYDPNSQEWLQITRDASIKYFFEDGRMSPLFPTLVSSLLNITKEDAQNKKTKTMKEWKATIDLLTENMLPRDESKIKLSAENNSLRGEISELKGKLNEIEKTNKHKDMIKTYTFSRKNNQDDIERFEALKRLMDAKDVEYEVSFSVDHDDEDDSDDDRIIIPNRGEITDNSYSGLTENRDILKKKSYVINQQRKIRSIRESSDTPLKKLTDLIASTAYDYTSGSAETRFVFANLGKRFRDDSAATYIVDAILIFAETEIKMGVTRTVRQWYDTITSVADKMQPVSDEKSQLKAENLSLKNKVRDLENQLRDAKELDKRRIVEIDKWHGSYEHAMTEMSMWQHNYEEAKKETLKRVENNKHEVAVLKQENSKLHESLYRLKKQHESDSVILETAKRYMSEKTLTPDAILRRFPDDEAYKKKEKALEDKIKNLQEKLGNESVPLSVLAEGLMDYAEEAGIHETHELFNHLNNLLINVPAWTKNVPELKKFFRKARKEMEGRNVTMTGEYATYNENNNK